MVDSISSETRNKIMASIPSQGTRPEKWIRSALHRQGFRFRLQDKKIPGTPDLVLRKYNALVFINGCFWHQHLHCKIAHVPKTRVEFWQKKFSRNLARDQKTLHQLKVLGWRVAVLWECALTKKHQQDTLKRLVLWLKWHSDYLEIPVYDEFIEP